jgi:hypothetical protein
MRVVKNIGAAVAATLMLLAPALWNGFPLLQYDTGGYIARWYEGTLEVSRSTVYGLFLNLLARPDFWPVVIVQAGLTAWILWLVLRVHGFGMRVFLITVAALSVLTTLPWIAGQLLTDIFAGLSVLALYLMVRRADALSRWERAGLFLFVAFSAATHSATLMVLLALLLAAAVVALFDRRMVPFFGVARGLAALVLGAVMLIAANYAVAGRPAWTPGGIATPFGRMLQTGIVARYLNDHCPDPRLRLCAYRADLPTDADVFFWGDSVFNQLGRFEGMNDEMRTIERESLVQYPWLQIKTAIIGTAEQLVKVRTGYGVITSIWHTHAMIERFVPTAEPAMHAARQQKGEVDFAVINRLHVPVAWAALVLLLGVIALGVARGRFADLGYLATTVALAIAANAFVCGALSNPHDRYGARISWLAPLVLLLVPWRAKRGDKSVPAQRFTAGRPGRWQESHS